MKFVNFFVNVFFYIFDLPEFLCDCKGQWCVSFGLHFGPRVYPMGSIVIALVSPLVRPSVGPSICPSLNISGTVSNYASGITPVRWILKIAVSGH